MIGVTCTLVLLASAFLAGSTGHADLARGLFWQNDLLQSLVSLNNISTAQAPVYLGTPFNVCAFLGSVPLGFVIYGVAAYVALRFLRRST